MTDLVGFAHAASIRLVLPRFRLVDAQPRYKSHAFLLPKRVEAAGKAFDLVLNRNGDMDSGHSLILG